MTKSALKPFHLLFLLGITYAQMNIAANGTASQSSNFLTFNAHLAITGGPTHDWETHSCSATDEEKTVAWWMLEFQSETVFISNVIIYYRDDLPGRLAGFSLYITNSSISPTDISPPSDGLCFKHNDENKPNILQNITCNQLGKNVVIYNERKDGVTYPSEYSSDALLELCDIQVIGCYKSLWGEGCKKPCPSYCLGQHCYPNNGACVWGCNSTNCLHGYCTNDGICTVGCIKGHAGSKCIKRNVANEVVMISEGGSETQFTQITDGDKTESCITLRGPDSWIQIDTGELRAVNTISIIFKGDTGYHEYNLSISSSSAIMAEKLNLTDQTIVQHVSPFSVNEHNLKSLVVGRYVLLNSAVSSLDICELEVIGCPSGLYGDQCDNACPTCDGACHPENGHCVFGCKNGYFGSQCEKFCTPPQFGGSCNGTCHCINQPCDFITGVCPSGGCQEGWIGQNCSREILCRTDTLPKYIKYLPSLSVYRYRQIVTFYCASGFYGTSVDSTCSADNTWIPSPPKCTIEADCEAVSVSLFVSILVSVIVIAVKCYMWRKDVAMSRQTNDKYDDLNVHQTQGMKAEINGTTYEELDSVMSRGVAT